MVATKFTTSDDFLFIVFLFYFNYFFVKNTLISQIVFKSFITDLGFLVQPSENPQPFQYFFIRLLLFVKRF